MPTKITEDKMERIHYHFGDKVVSYSTSTLPPVGSKVIVESDDDLLNNGRWVVTEVCIKIFHQPVTFEEGHVYLALDAVETTLDLLYNNLSATVTKSH